MKSINLSNVYRFLVLPIFLVMFSMCGVKNAFALVKIDAQYDRFGAGNSKTVSLTYNGKVIDDSVFQTNSGLEVRNFLIPDYFVGDPRNINISNTIEQRTRSGTFQLDITRMSRHKTSHFISIITNHGQAIAATDFLPFDKDVKYLEQSNGNEKATVSVATFGEGPTQRKVRVPVGSLGKELRQNNKTLVICDANECFKTATTFVRYKNGEPDAVDLTWTWPSVYPSTRRTSPSHVHEFKVVEAVPGVEVDHLSFFKNYSLTQKMINFISKESVEVSIETAGGAKELQWTRRLNLWNKIVTFDSEKIVVKYAGPMRPVNGSLNGPIVQLYLTIKSGSDNIDVDLRLTNSNDEEHGTVIGVPKLTVTGATDIVSDPWVPYGKTEEVNGLGPKVITAAGVSVELIRRENSNNATLLKNGTNNIIDFFRIYTDSPRYAKVDGKAMRDGVVMVDGNPDALNWTNNIFSNITGLPKLQGILSSEEITTQALKAFENNNSRWTLQKLPDHKYTTGVQDGNAPSGNSIFAVGYLPAIATNLRSKGGPLEATALREVLKTIEALNMGAESRQRVDRRVLINGDPVSFANWENKEGPQIKCWTQKVWFDSPRGTQSSSEDPKHPKYQERRTYLESRMSQSPFGSQLLGFGNQNDQHFFRGSQPMKDKLALIGSYSDIDSAVEEAYQELGCHGSWDPRRAIGLRHYGGAWSELVQNLIAAGPQAQNRGGSHGRSMERVQAVHGFAYMHPNQVPVEFFTKYLKQQDQLIGLTADSNGFVTRLSKFDPRHMNQAKLNGYLELMLNITGTPVNELSPQSSTVYWEGVLRHVSAIGQVLPHLHNPTAKALFDRYALSLDSYYDPNLGIVQQPSTGVWAHPWVGLESVVNKQGNITQVPPYQKLTYAGPNTGVKDFYEIQLTPTVVIMNKSVIKNYYRPEWNDPNYLARKRGNSPGLSFNFPALWTNQCEVNPTCIYNVSVP